MLDALRSLSCSLALVGCVLLCATQQSSRAQQPAPATAGTAAQQQPTPPQPKSISAGLGVYVLPAKNQSPDQQNADESSCYSWAKDQTGIDPLAPPPQTSAAPSQQAQQSAPDPSKGSGAKVAAGGAAAGAALGAIAGDAGEGA